jgi:hypothetical protein
MYSMDKESTNYFLQWPAIKIPPTIAHTANPFTLQVAIERIEKLAGFYKANLGESWVCNIKSSTLLCNIVNKRKMSGVEGLFLEQRGKLHPADVSRHFNLLW